MSRGSILVEVAIAYIIMTLAVVALLPVFILAIKANKNTEHIQTATYLSQELMEEIRMRKWDEQTPSDLSYASVPSPTLGPEFGETASNKANFDDIDDFHGWTETTIRDPLNGALADFPLYSRSVTIQYVDSSMTPTVGVTSDFKQVRVCSQYSGSNPVCLNSLITNH